MIILINSNNEGTQVECGKYPDGTLLMNLPEMEVPLVSWIYESDAELFALACIRKHYGGVMDLYMPYIPNARMDRVKNPTDVFTLKYFCEIINDLNFNHVFVIDPHSNVSLALLDRVVTMDVLPIVAKVVKDIQSIHEDKEIVLFFPDEGAMKRYKNIADVYPYTFGVKTRDWDTGKLSNLTVIDPNVVEGKVVLIVDDICSRGGTFKRATEALKEHCAEEIYLYVSHAEDTMYQGDMYKSDDMCGIYTLNGFGHHNVLDERGKVKLIELGGG